MATASSGTDPLARLQAGSKELRAERELCQVAAEKGFSTESGAATSTVMGSRMDDQALVESVENEVASALYFADSLPADIGNICLDPNVDADDFKHALCNIISSALNPWALHIVQGVKAQVLQQVQESIDKGNDAKKVMHKTLSDHIDNINTITDGIVDTAMEIFEAANPIGAKRREVIDTFEDEVQTAADLLVRKKEQETPHQQVSESCQLFTGCPQLAR